MASVKNFKQLLFSGIIVLLLLVSAYTFSQTISTRQNNDDRYQKVSDSLKETGIYTASAYFTGNGSQYVRSFKCSGSDLNTLMKMIDSASNGALIIFDELKFTSAAGVSKVIKEIPVNFNKSLKKDTIKSQAVLEVEKLKEVKFVSGTIYFSGFGFRNVSSVKASDTVMLYKYYSMSGPGTTITLDYCVYKNVNGSLSITLSKIVKLE